jgi:hypothetical protein
MSFVRLVKPMNKNLSLNEPLVDLRFLEDVPQKRKRPAWVRNEPIACVGAWETLFHRRRTGTTQVDDERFYAYEHSEQFVKEILGIGATLLITAYDKNYFVDEEEFALKKQLAAHCKKHGLKLSVYIRADQIYSEVFAERLHTNDLLARKADGRVPVYGAQEWRKNICFHKPGNLEAFQQSIRRAIVELDVDKLHLDGLQVGGTETYNACRCDACRRDFTAFLVRRWGDDPRACKRRFGHTHLEAIEPPGMSVLPAIPTGRVTDPVWQEWIRFRCTWTARITRIISEYAHELNPNVAILGNGGLAVRENAPLLLGYDVGSYCQHVDMMCNEDGFDPRITADGKILQRVRQHKLTHGAGAFLWNYMHQPELPERHLRIQLSHAAAFNAGRVTCMGHSVSCYADFRLAGGAKRRYLDWLRAHWQHYQDLENVSDVVVWREARAMAFAEPITYATAMRIEQLLIEDRIPFHIATGDWPFASGGYELESQSPSPLSSPPEGRGNSIDRHGPAAAALPSPLGGEGRVRGAASRVLVLPNLAFLDDAQCARVVQFVEQGGNLLVIGQTSILDGWGRRRSDFGLRAVLPANVKMPGLVFEQHVAAANDPVQPGKESVGDKEHFAPYQLGGGRIVYIPELVDPSTQPSLLNPDHTCHFGLDLTNWVVPEKSDAVRRALTWLLGDGPTFEVGTERGVIANYYRQPGTGRFYAHLVNLTDQRVAHVSIRMQLPAGRKAASVCAFSPDGPTHERIEWRIDGDNLIVVLEHLDVYAIIAIEIR